MEARASTPTRAWASTPTRARAATPTWVRQSLGPFLVSNPLWPNPVDNPCGQSLEPVPVSSPCGQSLWAIYVGSPWGQSASAAPVARQWAIPAGSHWRIPVNRPPGYLFVGNPCKQLSRGVSAAQKDVKRVQRVSYIVLHVLFLYYSF